MGERGERGEGGRKNHLDLSPGKKLFSLTWKKIVIFALPVAPRKPKIWNKVFHIPFSKHSKIKIIPQKFSTYLIVGHTF